MLPYTCLTLLTITILILNHHHLQWSRAYNNISHHSFTSHDSCPNLSKEWRRKRTTFPFCPKLKGNTSAGNVPIYFLYDVNPSEGFNLRRDVYIRLAVFFNYLQQKQQRRRRIEKEEIEVEKEENKSILNIQLILPPWRRLYHWRSHHLRQDHLAWHHFFDVESLKRFAPVLDYPEFIEEYQKLYGRNALIPWIPVHKLIRLEHYKDLYGDDGIYRDRWQWLQSPKDDDDDQLLLRGSYLLEKPLKLIDKRIYRLQYQGGARLLEQILKEVSGKLLHRSGSSFGPQIICILNAEVILHDHWSDRNFWLARRSMRFATPLQKRANLFRLENLQSTDEKDLIQRPPMWEYEHLKGHGKALGGPYLAIHIRRGDFVHGRQQTTPTLKSTALQIQHHLNELNLKTVFVATDATIFEVKNLRSYLSSGIRFVRFPVNDIREKEEFGDGGIAIIDQLICAHARRFVGTYESTFTYRIYEEREILGFPVNSTFHTLCKQATMEKCERNTVWSIVY